MFDRVQLQSFRCYASKEVVLGHTTILTGPNGSGKTAILEALALLSLTSSWRTERDSEVVRWGDPFCRVTSGEVELVVQVQPYLKRLKVDGVSQRTYQVIGRNPTVLFQPEDIAILTGAPSVRRHYLDRTISQTSSVYTRAILDLQPVLKQRNRLLKQMGEGQASDSELLFWDTELDRLHALIQPEREAFVLFLNQRVPTLFAEMVQGGGEVQIQYVPSPKHSILPFLEHLTTNRLKEVASGASLYGPHREDIELYWGEHLVSESMSRGQSRALLIACKVAELEYIAGRAEVRPLLLLDDIFSELDTERRERLFHVLGDYQTVMTTTELGSVEKLLNSQVEVVEL